MFEFFRYSFDYCDEICWIFFLIFNMLSHILSDPGVLKFHQVRILCNPIFMNDKVKNIYQTLLCEILANTIIYS